MTGVDWIVDANYSVAGLTTAKLAWNAVNDELDITLNTANDFVSFPVIVASKTTDQDGDYPGARVTESGGVLTAHLAFFRRNNGVKESVETTDMQANVVIIGAYV